MPRKALTLRERVTKRFKECLVQMQEMTDKKNHDYAGPDDPLANLRKHGEYGVVVRMGDKVMRLEQFFQPGSKRTLKVADEKITDTCIDLATYAILCLILSEENNRPLPKSVRKRNVRSSSESGQSDARLQSPSGA